MTTIERQVSLEQWLECNSLHPIEVDCVTALMLKIVDGKCKMNPRDKDVITQLYSLVQERKGIYFGTEYHQLISQAKAHPDPQLLERVYETRVLAETRISRSVMKTFKSRLRQNRLLPQQSAA